MGVRHPPERLTAIRVRQTVVATAIVGLGLAAGSVTTVALVRHSMLDNAQHQAEQRARDTAALLRLGPLPAVLPPAGEDQGVVQVVDSQRRVISASAELRGQPPLVPEWPGPQPLTTTRRRVPVGDGADYRVVGLRADSGGRPLAVYAGSSLEPVGDAVSATVSALAVAAPLLLAGVAGTSWWLVGRSLDRLRVAQERQRRFVSDASHELRGPLAAIRTLVEVGLAHPGETDWLALARHVHREGDRLDRLVDELLALSAVDADGTASPVEQVDIDEIVLSEVETLRARGTAAVDLSALSAVRLPGRPEQLRLMVRNLLDNAERHAACSITLRLSANGTTAELVVADDGEGVPPADRDRVFDPFVRLQPARDRHSGGTGLGLAIVRDVVTGHGGTVWFADATAGAEVHVRLPTGGSAAGTTGW